MPARSSVARRPLVGFTLVELLVVVTVVAILAAIAVPSFTQMIARARVGSAVSTLQAALLKARSEALKRNCSITLARSAGGWNAGWEVYATAADCSRAAGDEYDTAPLPGLMLHQDAVAGVIVEPDPAGLATVVYQRSGRVQGAGRAGPAFRVRDTRGVAKRRCVVVELDGTPIVVEAGESRCPLPP
jgi:type IV fimbrial biogenesis protein FimT